MFWRLFDILFALALMATIPGRMSLEVVKLKLLEANVKVVESMEAVNVLKSKYPREAGVITTLSARALVSKEIIEGPWIYSLMDGYGATHCVKNFYGKDGTQMLADLNVSIEYDEFMSSEDCFEKYGIKPKFGI